MFLHPPPPPHIALKIERSNFMINVLKFKAVYAILYLPFFMHLFHKLLDGNANSVDPDQTAPSGAV